MGRMCGRKGNEMERKIRDEREIRDEKGGWVMASG